jgi:hypothetical protein
MKNSTAVFNPVFNFLDTLTSDIREWHGGSHCVSTSFQPELRWRSINPPLIRRPNHNLDRARVQFKMV